MWGIGACFGASSRLLCINAAAYVLSQCLQVLRQDEMRVKTRAVACVCTWRCRLLCPTPAWLLKCQSQCVFCLACVRRWQEEAEAAKSDADGLNSEEEDGVMDLCFVSGQHLGKNTIQLETKAARLRCV